MSLSHDVQVCPVCNAPLPCYGRGLSRRAMEELARANRPEAFRRIKAHTRALVYAADPEGLTQRQIAAQLGMDPTGVDDTTRIVVRRDRGAAQDPPEDRESRAWPPAS